MNEDEKKKYVGEIDQILASRCEFIKRFYLKIRTPYREFYDWPELDPLRNEICICIMLGLCQAAIALTNHLMESLLKNALIIHDGNKGTATQDTAHGSPTDAFVRKYLPGQEKYGNANLDTTINRACTLGLITKAEKVRLHEFRDRFRNAYGHADRQKTFGDATIPVTGLKFGDGSVVHDEKAEPKIAQFLVAQGIIQAMQAESDAPPYFLYVDQLVRSVAAKLFGSATDDTTP